MSSARIAGMPLEGFCRELGLPYDEGALRKIADETRAKGLEIIRAKGATYYGIGTALARIADAILRDEHAILTVSSLTPASMELGEVSLSLPTIITRDGVARVVSIPVDASERQALEALLDVAHNPAGIWTLHSYLLSLLQEMAQVLFPLFARPNDHIHRVTVNNPRAADAMDISISTHVSIADAIKDAQATSYCIIVIAGSLYLVAEARTVLLGGSRMNTAYDFVICGAGSSRSVVARRFF
jgi:hypothetical protein